MSLIKPVKDTNRKFLLSIRPHPTNCGRPILHERCSAKMLIFDEFRPRITGQICGPANFQNMLSCQFVTSEGFGKFVAGTGERVPIAICMAVFLGKTRSLP